MSVQDHLPFLPLGWIHTTLHTISIQITKGSTPTSYGFAYKSEGIKFIKTENITSEGTINEVTDYIDEKTNAFLKRSILQKDDLLFSIAGTIGRVGIVQERNLPANTNQALAIIRLVKEYVNSKFIFYYLRSDFVQKKALAAIIGVGRANVSLTNVGEFDVSLPPLPEQPRIVDEIEKQFSRLDSAVDILQRVERNLERLRTAMLKAAVEGQLVPTEAELARAEERDYEPANELLQRILRERRAKWEANQLTKMKEQGKTPTDDKWKAKYKEPVLPETDELPELQKGWTWATVDQLASFEPSSLTDGPFGSNLKTSHYTTKGPRVIRLQNIGDGYFIDEHAYISEEHFQALQKHQIFAGDIVIASLGEIAPRACIIPIFVGKAIVKADCIRFKPNSDIAVTNYINYALNSEPTRERTAAFIHGVGRPRLGLGGIREIALPLPPVDEQRRIVAEVERRISVIEELKTLVSNALRRAAILRQKILRDAFAGKLVPQDPADEHARLLLERIHAEKAERETEANKARKERRIAMIGHTPRASQRKPRRPLREVVTESKRRLTPEQLFAEAGFTTEVVEDFYEELRREIKAGHIEQVRPDNAKIYLMVPSA